MFFSFLIYLVFVEQRIRNCVNEMRLRGNLKSRSKAWYHDSIQESLMERTVNYMHGEIKKKKNFFFRGPQPALAVKTPE